MFSSPEGVLIDAVSSHKPPSRTKKETKSKVPALPVPQVITQSISPPPNWQPRYPAAYGTANMIKLQIQTFPQPTLLSHSSLNHQRPVLAYSRHGIPTCYQVLTSWSSRLLQ